MKRRKEPPLPVANERKYPIAELAALHGVSLRTLRFYESKGLLSPKRTMGTRLYTARDCARLEAILVGKRLGFTLHDIARLLSIREDVLSREVPMGLSVEEVEQQIAILSESRAALDAAITDLGRALARRTP